MHTFTHRRLSQPRAATASSSGAVRVRCLAQGHLDSQLGAAGDRTNNLPVTGQPTLPPEPHAAPKVQLQPSEGLNLLQQMQLKALWIG